LTDSRFIFFPPFRLVSFWTPSLEAEEMSPVSCDSLSILPLLFSPPRQEDGPSFVMRLKLSTTISAQDGFLFRRHNVISLILRPFCSFFLLSPDCYLVGEEGFSSLPLLKPTFRCFSTPKRLLQVWFFSESPMFFPLQSRIICRSIF